MKNLDKKNFRFIIIESPSNIIEDINCIFDTYIEFQQIKKKDEGQWTKSTIEAVIDHFFRIYSENREEIYKKLNLDLVKQLDFKFLFITDQGYNSGIRDFLIFLEKHQNNERDAEDEFQELNYFIKGKDKDKFFNFLNYLKLIFKFYPSRNPESTTDGVEEECLNRIEKRFKVDRTISKNVLSEILKLISKKSEGKIVKSRTFYKNDLDKVVMFCKTNENKKLREELPICFEIVISCIEQHIETIEQIIINSEYKKNDNKFDIPLKININDKWYFFNLIDRKITRELKSDLNRLKELLNEDDNTIILLFRGNLLNLGGLEIENCFSSNEKERFKKYFEELI